MTIKEIAFIHGGKPNSIYQKVKRAGFLKPNGSYYSKTDELPGSVLEFLGINKLEEKVESKSKNLVVAAPVVAEVIAKPKVAKPTKKTLTELLIVFLKFAPLPMLGLAAAHGVYSFSLMFGSGLSGEIFAWITAAAFEATYIGLSLTEFKDMKQRRLAKKTALGAVMVSAIFNSLSGVFVYNQSWILSLVHGVPLAVIGYLVAELRFQTNKSK